MSNITAKQSLLSDQQVEAFRHDEFVADQARHFLQLVGPEQRTGTVVDIGGGCGFFAKRIADLSGVNVRVLDTDVASIAACRSVGVEAGAGDALNPVVNGDEEIVTFNLILHHLVGMSEGATAALQRRALEVWRSQVQAVFVNEYIYESYLGTLSGWVIFQITKSKLLSWIGRMVGRVVPSLNANTFGVGVRFRAHREWIAMFEQAGYVVRSTLIGENEPVSLARRVLFIKHIRRDSFLIVPAKAT